MQTQTEIFRREALEHYQAAEGNQGGLLELTPVWISRAFRLVLLAAALGLAFLLFGKVNEYAIGPAIIRAQGRTDVVTRAAGTLLSIDVLPGQQVKTGQVLVRLESAVESVELARLEEEFELQLAKSLRDPADAAAKQALIALRSARERARAELGRRSVLAPHDGTVSDLRIRPGQYLPAGAPVLTLTRGDATFQVVAALPGEFRPMIRERAPLRLEVTGYRYAYQDMALDAANSQVVGTAEVERFLGKEFAAQLDSTALVFLVEATVPGPAFEVEGERWRYHDGMLARARVQARRTRILYLLLPWLRAAVP